MENTDLLNHEGRRLLSETSDMEKIDEDEKKDADDDQTDPKVKTREFEELLDSAGFGFFHVLLMILSGAALASDAIEEVGVAFVVPIAEEDLDLTTVRKGYLDGSVFVG